LTGGRPEPEPGLPDCSLPPTCPHPGFAMDESGFPRPGIVRRKTGRIIRKSGMQTTRKAGIIGACHLPPFAAADEAARSGSAPGRAAPVGGGRVPMPPVRGGAGGSLCLRFLPSGPS
jgi:hypothetical protein